MGQCESSLIIESAIGYSLIPTLFLCTPPLIHTHTHTFNLLRPPGCGDGLEALSGQVVFLHSVLLTGHIIRHPVQGVGHGFIGQLAGYAPVLTAQVYVGDGGDVRELERFEAPAVGLLAISLCPVEGAGEGGRQRAEREEGKKGGGEEEEGERERKREREERESNFVSRLLPLS